MRDLPGLFRVLRERGLDLGVGELLDGELLRSRTPTDADLQRSLTLLWCKSASDRALFTEVWEGPTELRHGDSPSARQETGTPPRPDDPLPEPSSAVAPPGPDGRPSPSAPASETPLAPAAVRIPPEPGPPRRTAPPRRIGPPLRPYWPVSRREMGYAWARLRRPVRDGPWTRLDLAATVDRAAREGLYRGPVYTRELRNRAHLVLLVDRRGSMVPFHPLTRDLVETARANRTGARVEVYYFQNWAGEYLFADPFLVEGTPLPAVLARLSPETRVLVVSDAGAARGQRRAVRITGTRRFLRQVRSQTAHLAWLNPMPEGRWEGTSAEMLARDIAMFPLDRPGLLRALRYLAGATGELP